MSQNLLIFLACCLIACSGSSGKKEVEKRADGFVFDLQGHRGARGLMPENSLQAFQKALELGVNTLELDLAVTKDRQLVVSHEPWLSHSICLDSTGNAITAEQEKAFNIYEMTYAQLQKFDCGSMGNERFPEQQAVSATKPLLSEVIALANAFMKSYPERDPVLFNIEIKSFPDGDGTFHPAPAGFSDLLFQCLDSLLTPERVVIQSFDFRVLKYWQANYPEYRLAALIGDEQPAQEQLAKLGFIPAIYSPWYKFLDSSQVSNLQKQGMQVIPWTVNETDEMRQLLQWGVDGIITDYPDRALVLRP